AEAMRYDVYACVPPSLGVPLEVLPESADHGCSEEGDPEGEGTEITVFIHMDLHIHLPFPQQGCEPVLPGAEGPDSMNQDDHMLAPVAGRRHGSSLQAFPDESRTRWQRPRLPPVPRKKLRPLCSRCLQNANRDRRDCHGGFGVRS